MQPAEAGGAGAHVEVDDPRGAKRANLGGFDFDGAEVPAAFLDLTDCGGESPPQWPWRQYAEVGPDVARGLSFPLELVHEVAQRTGNITHHGEAVNPVGAARIRDHTGARRS